MNYFYSPAMAHWILASLVRTSSQIFLFSLGLGSSHWKNIFGILAYRYVGQKTTLHHVSFFLFHHFSEYKDWGRGRGGGRGGGGAVIRW